MARRRRIRTRVTRRRASPMKRVKRYAKSTTRGTALIQPDSMVYGAGRRYLSKLISPVTVKLGMLGNLSDNAILGAGMWLIAKKSKGFVRDIAIKGLVAENVLAGDDIASNFITKSANTGNNTAW